MKKYLFIFCLVAFLGACSDDNDKVLEKDPFLPVTGLDIPKKEFVETEVTIKGQGFMPDCEIWLQYNGGESTKMEVVSVTDAGVVFKVPLMDAGFYVVILKQEGKEYRIGGINLLLYNLTEEDIEAYGVYGDISADIRPVSISKKIVGQPIFKTREGYDFGGVVTTPGKVYCSYYTPEWISQPGKPSMTLLKYNICVYDFATKELKTIELEHQYEYFAMGVIDGKLHLLLTSDYSIYRLVELDDDGNETPVMDFDLTAISGKRMSEFDNKFEYDEAGNNILLTGQSLSGSDLQQFAWALNLTTGEVRSNGGDPTVHYFLVDCEGVFYCFARIGDDVFDTPVLRLKTPWEWSYNDASLKVGLLAGINFESPVYDPSKKVIYGVGEDETVMTFDPAKNTIVKKWVKSGMMRVFIKE